MAGRRRQAQGGGVNAVQQLANERLKEGEEGAYEALQLYRGQCSRRIQKKGQEDFAGAIEIASIGAKTLFDAGYLDMGADLAIYLVQLYSDAKLEVSDATRDVLVELDKKFDSKSNKRLKFAKAAVKWSIDCGARAYGDPALHFRLGDTYLRRSQIEFCARHLVYGEQPLLIAHILCEQQVPHEAREILICRGILHFISLENLRDANRLMQAYFQNIATGKVQPPSPGHLTAFTKYAAKTCERNAAPLFQDLVQRYDSILGAHPDLNMYIGQIAERYFGLVRQGGNSMLENMMKMFMGDGAQA